MSVTAETPTVAIQSDSVIDRTNQRAVAGFATHIFFGRVTAPAPTSTTEKRGLLESQYKVQVIESLKGDATGVVTVNQVGGLKEGKVFIEEGDTLLAPDREYLFATRFSQSQTWYTVVPVAGDVPVSDSSTTTAGRARPALDKGQARAQMKASIAALIPFKGPAAAPSAPRTTPPATPSASSALPDATTSASPSPANPSSSGVPAPTTTG